MQFETDVMVHAIKESKGEFQGRAFSSTTFHCEVDLKENGAGRSMGHVTRPLKLADAAEYEKWLPYADHLSRGPIKCRAVLEIGAAREDGTSLALVSIRPAPREAKAA